ncbi:unnamed protein product [Calypogeia fissa]
MAAPLAWVAAPPSEDEEEDEVQQRPKVLPAAAVEGEGEFHVVEDEDVQVLNVVKSQEQPPQPGLQAEGRYVHPLQVFWSENIPGAPQHRMDVGGEGFSHFKATATHPHYHQQVEPISRSQRRKEAQKQKRRLTTNFETQSGRDIDGDLYCVGGGEAPWREEGIPRGEPPSHLRRQEVSWRGHTSANVDQAHLNGRRVVQEQYCSVMGGQQPREYGILGGGPASQVRKQGTIERGNVHHLLGQGLLVSEGEPVMASTGCERMLLAQGFSYGRHVEQESLHTIRSPDPRVQGFLGTGLGTTPYSLESMVTGKTMDEWWSSLREIVGTNLSKLHWDIVKFCKDLELTRDQKQIRREALEYVEKTVHELWPSAQVHLFGSTATGLALPWSDIDVAVISSHQDYSGQKCAIVSWLSELSRHLKRHGQCQSVKQIPHAKVPLLKVVFKSGLACDISFDSHNGPRGVPVIRHFMQQYEALHPLCLVLKSFLGHQNLNELWTGGLGSFCLIIMVVSHLQKLGVTGTGHDLGLLLLSFFTRYSTMHDYKTDVVSTRADFYASKQAKGWVNFKDPELLSVEDPLDPTSDIAKGSYKIKNVRAKFLNAKTLLLTHWHQDNVLAKLYEVVGNLNHGPKAQTEKSQGLKQRKQKKRKNCATTGSEMEDGQPIEFRRKQKAQCKQAIGLAGKTKKQKNKPKNNPKKKGKRAAAKESQVDKILTDVWDPRSSGFQSRLKRARR